MPETLSVGQRRLELDEEWGLLEFSDFGRQYVQTYSFLYALSAADSDEDSAERVGRAFGAYPWRGGWSAVDFYDALRAVVPKHHRPRVKHIEYASPGFIELALVVSVAAAIKKVVRAICSSIDDVNNTYTNIQNGLQQRKLARISLQRAQLELTREQLAFVEQAAGQLSATMDFQELETVRSLAPSQLVTLKILLSFYRRARHLAKLERSGHIRF